MYTIGKLVIIVVLCTTLFSNQSSAQTRFCIGGDLDHLSVAQRNTCAAKMNQVRLAAAKYRAPADWHFVVVCTDSDWSDYAAFSRRSPAELKEVSADTDLRQRTTFFRGASLFEGPDGNLQQLVTYEIASIKLKSTDKVAIQQQVARWTSDSGKHPPELSASHPATATGQAGS